MKPYINVHLYPQTQTVETNIYYYSRNNKLTKYTDERYMVDHIYEILFPIVEKYGQTHNIYVKMDGEMLDISELEHSYYQAIEDNQ